MVTYVVPTGTVLVDGLNSKRDGSATRGYQFDTWVGLLGGPDATREYDEANHGTYTRF